MLFTLAQGLLRLLAFDELSQLSANARHHGKLLWVRLPNIGTKKHQRSERFIAEHDGNPQRAAQTSRCGHGTAQKIAVLRDIGYPRRLRAFPHAPCQTNPGGKGEASTLRGKFRQLLRWRMPRFE